MSRSRRRKLARNEAGKRYTVIRSAIPVASALLAAAVRVACAQEAPPATNQADVSSGGLEEVVVTAQKRVENLQDVPISVEVFDTAKLEQLNILDIDDYVKFTPSIAYVRGEGQGGNGNPGESHIYIRGVVSGGTNHSGSQPSVGEYLDEQPVTTIDGNVDVHIYDIQRIEVLEGPQGTLYGASSQSGTVRIITNKPDPTKFSGGVDVQGNKILGHAGGYEFEGFLNIPLAPDMAIRLVGWDEKDGGYISNVQGTNANGCIANGVRTFPTWDGVASSYPAVTPCPAPGVIGAGAITNAPWAKNDYNPVETKGGRAALRWILGDWTITPTFMAQNVASQGFFGYDPAVGFLDLVHFSPENSTDVWQQGALTIEGKVSNFDIVYSGGYFKRVSHTLADYADYSEFYDRVYGSGAYWTGNNGSPIMPQELVISRHIFEKWSHEARISTPADLPVKGTLGLFIQRQQHNILEDYVMPGYGWTNPYGGNPNGYATALSIPGLDNTIWLTDETRVDRDQAVFGQVEWDITQQLQLTGGLRFYKYDNTLDGFFGYSAAHGGSGMGHCFGPDTTVEFAPCTDLEKRIADHGTVPRINLTYKFTPDVMLYATYSKGFRPGGVNRTADVNIGPYTADYLKNYEVGWKTQFFNHHLRWNGALFLEDWDNFQYSFLGVNSVTIIENGASARITGLESNLEWSVNNALYVSANFDLLNPRLTSTLCSNGPPCPSATSYLWAPYGTNLPVTPKFKGNLVVRYTLPPIADWVPYWQGSMMYQTTTEPALRVDQAAVEGRIPAYALADLSLGVNHEQWLVELFLKNVFNRDAELSRFTQTAPTYYTGAPTPVDTQAYIIPVQPRTIGARVAVRF